MEFTFETLPMAVSLLFGKIDQLENLIKNSGISPIENEDEIFDVAQAAAFIRLEPQTVYGLVSKREIPHMKKSRKLYFSKLELLVWLKEGKQKTKNEIDRDMSRLPASRQRFRQPV